MISFGHAVDFHIILFVICHSPGSFAIVSSEASVFRVEHSELASTGMNLSNCFAILSDSRTTPINSYIRYLRCISLRYSGLIAAVSPPIPDPSHESPAPSHEIFLWLEFPTFQQKSEWQGFYESAISFVRSNSANYLVSKLVVRVLHPNFGRDQGLLWQIGTDSVFYTHFLSLLPSTIEVCVLPYLLEASSAAFWISTMHTATPLEGVYKYVAEWNMFLAGLPGYFGPRIVGIVADHEEQRGYISTIGLIPELRDKYSTAGYEPLRFGTTVGFDGTGSILQMPAYVDDVYVEMYDFYLHGVSAVHPIPANLPGILDNPDGYIDLLDSEVWETHLDDFASSSKINFMWSLQHTGNDCLFPLDTGHCGERNDLGSWTPEAAREFLTLVRERHSVFGERPNGFFQFSFMPPSWIL